MDINSVKDIALNVTSSKCSTDNSNISPPFQSLPNIKFSPLKQDFNYKSKNEIKFKTYEFDKKIETNNSEKSKYFKCPVKSCDKVFPKECNLKDHVRTHTGEKPFKCSHPGCGKKFTQQGNLKKHQNVHLGEKKFVCQFMNCGKKFSASYNLKVIFF
jgi:hypothetical protein